MKRDRNYGIGDINMEEILDKRLIDEVKRNKLMKMAMNVSLAVFGISLFFAGFMVMMDGYSNAYFGTTLGRNNGRIMAISMLLYIFFIISMRSIPSKSWKCPKCKKGLSFFVPIGKKAGMTNRVAQKKIDALGFRYGTVKGSTLIVPEECPYCGKKFLQDK